MGSESRLKMHSGHLLAHDTTNPSQTTPTSYNNLNRPGQNNTSNKTLLRGTASLIIWGSVDGTAVDEEALNAWWTNEHLPERLAIPGFLRTRRYYAHSHSESQSSSSSSHYLVWYEVSSLETLTSSAYTSALDDPTPNTKHFMPLLASMNRSACRLVYSTTRPELLVNTGAGGTLAHIVFQPPFSLVQRQELRSWIIDSAWSAVLAPYHACLALHFFEHDEHATRAGSSTKSYQAVRFQEDQSQTRGASGRTITEDNTTTSTTTPPPPPNSTTTSTSGGRWMLMLEFAEPLGASFGKAQVITDSIVRHLQALHADNVHARLYGLICALAV
ncbi:hypothetical protein HRR83_005762 [Exophiala dermatitidis]|uniref:Uncharacterized protein n=2 Tax=Exophiala dermatitidis TaxID=5970 RepID=H6BV66_EXODN|nr:uncharacterized protein HMPREF1120_03138 [Exophiala dermatitidis NIH/UT8656]KAJ4508670.1 hypothetical protein HRR73_007337 [Exophiala dermatitidis]EHY54980.1 hypothetical protein HMPREF1120_03138 [Exophiala dermatitidis NIH/UT8656]KAJ4510921.1 hypothetical protein HRR75_005615 [Exophiala dermatitidis]KAJ4513318.1 hypothetical protein HRR74_006130 [Exophiala dermatitidis]KAJ4538131.1 hypothetical protein HRR77_007171 [Exophiala dermatitidis]